MRSNPTTPRLNELGLSGWNSHGSVVATIDQKRSRPSMAEVLTYAVTPAAQGGWDGESTIWFIEKETGRVGYLCRVGADRMLCLDVVGIVNDWLGGLRVLVFVTLCLYWTRCLIRD